MSSCRLDKHINFQPAALSTVFFLSILLQCLHSFEFRKSFLIKHKKTPFNRSKWSKLWLSSPLRALPSLVSCRLVVLSPSTLTLLLRNGASRARATLRGLPPPAPPRLARLARPLTRLAPSLPPPRAPPRLLLVTTAPAPSLALLRAPPRLLVVTTPPPPSLLTLL